MTSGDSAPVPRADRLHSLDALRAFALLLGVFFHGAAGYVENFPAGLWPWREPSSTTLGVYFFVSHIFRMSLFFMLAGFFGRMVLERRGMRAFIRDRSKRILLPLAGGLPIVLVSTGVLGGLGTFLGGGVDALTALQAPPQAGEGAAAAAPPPGTFPWVHLWFLYYLLIFYAGALGLRSVCDGFLDRGGHLRRALDVIVRVALSGAWGAALVGVPLAVYFSRLEGWSSWTGLPAPLTLLPQVPSLVGYGTAFGFGWVSHRQMHRLLALERQWLVFLPLAVVLSAVALYLGGTTPHFGPTLEGRALLVYCVVYFVAMWCWIFGLTGAAVRFLSSESPARRYVADSSYWLYLMHLPVLAFFAGLLHQVPMHWTLKYPLQVAGTLVVLFVSYRYLVRSTVIGAILNGRRYSRGVRVRPEPVSAA
jgi:glucans biosynthesis protein C